MDGKIIYRILLIKKDGNEIELAVTEIKNLAEDYYKSFKPNKDQDSRIVKEVYLRTNSTERSFL